MSALLFCFCFFFKSGGDAGGADGVAERRADGAGGVHCGALVGGAPPAHLPQTHRPRVVAGEPRPRQKQEAAVGVAGVAGVVVVGRRFRRGGRLRFRRQRPAGLSLSLSLFLSLPRPMSDRLPVGYVIDQKRK